MPVVLEPGVVALEFDVRHLKHAAVTFTMCGVSAAAVPLDEGFDGGQPQPADVLPWFNFQLGFNVAERCLQVLRGLVGVCSRNGDFCTLRPGSFPRGLVRLGSGGIVSVWGIP